VEKKVRIEPTPSFRCTSRTKAFTVANNVGSQTIAAPDPQQAQESRTKTDFRSSTSTPEINPSPFQVLQNTHREHPSSPIDTNRELTSIVSKQNQQTVHNETRSLPSTPRAPLEQTLWYEKNNEEPQERSQSPLEKYISVTGSAVKLATGAAREYGEAMKRKEALLETKMNALQSRNKELAIREAFVGDKEKQLLSREKLVAEKEQHRVVSLEQREELVKEHEKRNYEEESRLREWAKELDGKEKRMQPALKTMEKLRTQLNSVTEGSNSSGIGSQRSSL